MLSPLHNTDANTIDAIATDVYVSYVTTDANAANSHASRVNAADACTIDASAT